MIKINVLISKELERFFKRQLDPFFDWSSDLALHKNAAVC
jgi:hypothetical protein